MGFENFSMFPSDNRISHKSVLNSKSIQVTKALLSKYDGKKDMRQEIVTDMILASNAFQKNSKAIVIKTGSRTLFSDNEM